MIHLKRATAEDAELILDINTKAFNNEMLNVLGREGGPPGYNSIDEHLRLINEFYVYLIKLNEVVIGSFFLIPISDTHCSLESFCIYPKFQGYGYGFNTLEVMEKENEKITKWSLGAFKKSKRIQKLYERFGYKKVDEDEWEITYEKNIKIGFNT